MVMDRHWAEAMLPAVRETRTEYEEGRNKTYNNVCRLCTAGMKYLGGNTLTEACPVCPWTVFTGKSCTVSSYLRDLIPDRIARLTRWERKLLDILDASSVQDLKEEPMKKLVLKDEEDVLEIDPKRLVKVECLRGGDGVRVADVGGWQSEMQFKTSGEFQGHGFFLGDVYDWVIGKSGSHTVLLPLRKEPK